MSSAVIERERTGVTADLHALLDSLAGIDLDRLPGLELSVLLASLTKAQSRIGALRFKVLAAADRRDVRSESGATCTGAWASTVLNEDQVVTVQQVKLATDLETRTATQVALAAGLITPEHARIIVAAVADLPQRLDEAARAEVEKTLVAKAQTMTPSALRRAARRALEAIEPDPQVVDEHENDLVTRQEERARARVRLSLHDNGDGTTTGRFTVPTLHGELLRKIIQTITAPRRGRPGATHTQTGLGARTDGATDWDRARGEALCELIEHLPTDHLHPRTAATIVVTLTEESLTTRLRVADLDTGSPLSAGQARRLACNAAIIPAVLGTNSLPLDLGRASRLFTEAQRTALGLVHRTCIAHGCERPYAWCELHHQHPWSTHGPTNLNNAIPACHFHHQRLHDPHYTHQPHPDGTITFHRRN